MDSSLGATPCRASVGGTLGGNTSLPSLSHLHPPVLLQSQEVISSEAFQANDTERALIQAYLRMDELLVKVGSGGEVGVGCTTCCTGGMGVCHGYWVPSRDVSKSWGVPAWAGGAS